MADAPKLYVDEMVDEATNSWDLRAATPAEVAAWLREHHPEVLLREAAEVLRRMIWPHADISAMFEEADRLEKETDRG